jgi:hypothetical protein
MTRRPGKHADLRDLGSPFDWAAEELIAGWLGMPHQKGSPRIQGTKSIADSVLGAMKRLHISESGPLDALAGRWPGIVGAERAGKCHPVSLKSGRLVIAVANPLLRMDLQLDTLRILREVRTVPGCETVKTLMLRAG